MQNKGRGRTLLSLVWQESKGWPNQCLTIKQKAKGVGILHKKNKNIKIMSKNWLKTEKVNLLN